MLWTEHLRRDAEATEDFRRALGELKDRALENMRGAVQTRDWEHAASSEGLACAYDEVLDLVNRAEQAEVEHGQASQRRKAAGG